MADAYQGPLTVALLEKGDSEIAQIIAGLPDDAEIIATPMMDELVYRRKDYSRGINICTRFFRESVSRLRQAQMYIAMVNLARRNPLPNMERIDYWMREAGGLIDQMDINAPGVLRTKVMWRYNAALLARLAGNFLMEAFHHSETNKLAADVFSRNNAAYMAEVATMLHHAKEGTATDELWRDFLAAGDNYRATLDQSVPREAQWIANDWGHRTELASLLSERREEEYWIDEGFHALIHLLSRGVPQRARFAADLLVSMTLLEYGAEFTLWQIKRILDADSADNDWRMLAALFKACITGQAEDFHAVTIMPGAGICHAARAVANRLIASMSS